MFWKREIMFYKDHFCQGAKMHNQSFRLGFVAGMVVTNTIFVLEKFFINIFPIKDFLNSIIFLNSKSG
jgi:hypothetical protein